MSKSDDEIAVGAWRTHREDCADCAQVDHLVPRTIAAACLRGAPMLRDYLAVLAKADPERRKRKREDAALAKSARGEYRTTKAKAKAAMRYVGEAYLGEAHD